ncbi:MAG: flavin-containing monooxygenase [Solirubrobacteraceae bacterium]
MGSLRTPRVAVIGAGVSGICMAIKLREAGIESFTVFEKSDRVGGTWRDNTYPGLFCDVPSRYFQYSFALSAEWTRMYSPGPEIDRYIEGIVDRYGLREKIAFGVEVAQAHWRDGRWHLSSTTGETFEADFILTGCGFLHRPLIPEIEGLGRFAGAMFHSARWDHGVELANKRVGIIGTGSTGVQIVTEIAGKTRSLTQFTRTPQWVAPIPNQRYTRLTRSLYRRFPALRDVAYRGHQWTFESVLFPALVHDGWQRRLISALCRANLRSVRDPELRRTLTPDYEPGCKRLVASAGYYRAVQRHGVGIVRAAIDHVEPDAIVTDDGTRHELDVIVLATGFDTHALVRPIEFVVGDVRLSDAWADGPRGYATVAVAGFPNLFMAMGPNTPVNDSSMFNVAETQVGYAMNLIERWRRREFDAIAPTREATDRFNAELRAALPGTIWVTGCSSWYIGEDGTPEIWPWLPQRHRAVLREPVLADYEAVPALVRASAS